ncbi:hypothetical protein [Roseicyclus mahoneyensis]|uniref:Flagellar assembly protein FliH n=1 Tax=Roseicyclus mahoneyensis TaxID=164332 RepID=A0A316GIN8_9RHOB|nr:hypothetical protein [Roseicyclus mahoneyensis]PWK60394.1 hypothetical protein C7455_10430 [Roseicyclus mahoneyensis]
MQDLSPEAIDHAEIMRLIREGGAFRATPALPAQVGAGTPGFQAAPAPVAAAPRADLPPQTPDAGFHPAPTPPAIDLDALRAEARAEGRAEAEALIDAALADGHARGHAEAMARAARDLTEARSALLSAADSLADASEAAVASLFAAVEAAVLRLAADRAGMAIDANPAPFRARIEALAARIARTGAMAQITLNPADLAALEPDAPAGRFVADASLARGDAVIRMGDIVIEDILAGSPR